MGKWENKKEKLLSYWIVNLRGNFLIFNIFISWDRNKISSFGKEIPVELAKHERELLCLFGFCFCFALLRCMKRGFCASLLGQCFNNIPSGQCGRRQSIREIAGQEKATVSSERLCAHSFVVIIFQWLTWLRNSSLSCIPHIIWVGPV